MNYNWLTAQFVFKRYASLVPIPLFRINSVLEQLDDNATDDGTEKEDTKDS